VGDALPRGIGTSLIVVVLVLDLLNVVGNLPFPASKEVENEDEDDWGSTLYRAKHDPARPYHPSEDLVDRCGYMVRVA
jgi:hypothetical protein